MKNVQKIPSVLRSRNSFFFPTHFTFSAYGPIKQADKETNQREEIKWIQVYGTNTWPYRNWAQRNGQSLCLRSILTKNFLKKKMFRIVTWQEEDFGTERSYKQKKQTSGRVHWQGRRVRLSKACPVDACSCGAALDRQSLELSLVINSCPFPAGEQAFSYRSVLRLGTRGRMKGSSVSTADSQ